MTWTLTGDVAEYLATAGTFLRSRPAEHTILLTATETIRVRGTFAYGEFAPLFGWWQRPDGTPSATFVHTPPFPVALSAMTAEAVTALAGVFAGRNQAISGVHGDTVCAPAFASAWRSHTGQPFGVSMRMRLYRLEGLTVPGPGPDGQARVAMAADRELLVTWLDAFQRETDSGPPGRSAEIADDGIGRGGFTIWEVDGEPVSMAAAHPQVAGHVRVGPVYTPPDRRRRGFGAAATAAVTAAALEAGARDVVLFTDLANPTSNSIYQRLGFQPIGDRIVLAFGPGQASA